MRGPLICLSGEPRQRPFGLALARHLETLLLTSRQGWPAVEVEQAEPNPPGADTLLGATATLGELPFPVLSLDLAAAARMSPARQHLLLHDDRPAIEARLDRAARGGGALGLLRLLRQAEGVIAFAPSGAGFLQQLGCAVRATAPLPALLPALGAAPAATTVLVINHLGRDKAARRACQALRRALPEIALIGVAEAATPGLASARTWHEDATGSAAVHLHVGLPATEAAHAPRLVDSFACRRPVLLFLPAPSADLPSGPLPIAHEADGFVATDEAALTAGLRALLGDPVFAGILARNAERRAHGFNQDCAAALRAAAPELFA
jgi:hypothetical protein